MEHTLTIALDQESYEALERHAARFDADMSEVAGDILRARLLMLEEGDERAHWLALPMDERRRLAEQAAGSLKLPNGLTAAEWVRKLRDDEWSGVEDRIDTSDNLAKKALIA